MSSLKHFKIKKCFIFFTGLYATYWYLKKYEVMANRWAIWDKTSLYQWLTILNKNNPQSYPQALWIVKISNFFVIFFILSIDKQDVDN